MDERQRNYLSQELEITLAQELRNSVIHKVDKWWSDLISKGDFVPEEAKTEEDLRNFKRQMKAFNKWVGAMTEVVLASAEQYSHLNVVGIGRGGDFRQILLAANACKVEVKAFDSSKESCRRAKKIIGQFGSLPTHHEVFHADAESACQAKYMDPKHSQYLILVRVLEALNKAAGDPQKMERTARAIGKMLSHLKVMVIGARLEDNIGVKFNNTEPVPLESIIRPMEEGFGGQIVATELGEKFQLCKHIYRAHLIEKKAK